MARVNFSHAFVSFLHKKISQFEFEANCCSAKRRLKREGLFAVAGAVLEWEMEPVGLHCCPYPGQSVLTSWALWCGSIILMRCGSSVNELKQRRSSRNRLP